MQCLKSLKKLPVCQSLGLPNKPMSSELRSKPFSGNSYLLHGDGQSPHNPTDKSLAKCTPASWFESTTSRGHVPQSLVPSNRPDKLTLLLHTLYNRPLRWPSWKSANPTWRLASSSVQSMHIIIVRYWCLIRHQQIQIMQSSMRYKNNAVKFLFWFLTLLYAVSTAELYTFTCNSTLPGTNSLTLCFFEDSFLLLYTLAEKEKKFQYRWEKQREVPSQTWPISCDKAPGLSTEMTLITTYSNVHRQRLNVSLINSFKMYHLKKSIYSGKYMHYTNLQN